MPPLYDSRAFSPKQSSPTPLTQGLDQTTTPMLSSPGSLQDTVNVELVDDVLKSMQGGLELGTLPINSFPETFYVLYGENPVEFIIDTPPDDYQRVQWYKNDIWWGVPVGSGLIKEVTLTGQPNDHDKAYIISHIEGTTPEEYTQFTIEVAGTEVSCIRISSGDGFIMPSRYTPTITAGIMRQLNWEYYLSEETSTDWDAIRPKPLGNGAVSHLFQLEDVSYAVRDYLVGKFISGTEEPSIGDEIELDALAGTDPTYFLADVELTAGSWVGGDAEGWLYLLPGLGSTLVDATMNVWNEQSVQPVNNVTTANQLGTTPSQTAPATQTNTKSHGVMWKIDTDNRANTGWKYVDIGFSLNFKDGEKAPLAIEAPIVVTDAISAFQDTGDVVLVSPATEYPVTGTYSAWTGLGNLAADDGATCDSPILASDYSRVLELQSTADLVPGDSTIIGIEVSFEASQTVGTDAYIEKVQLRNDATGATEFLSNDKGSAEMLTTAPTVYTFGAQQDIFGWTELLQDTINDQDLTVLLQFGNSNGGVTRTVQVDYVNIKVHYIQKGQDVYIYDGSSDVATGTLYAYQVFDGDWSTDDATGWMTLHDVTSPSAVFSDMQVRSEASGSGDLIAVTKHLSKNLLPSYDEMRKRSARCQDIVSSIGGGEENIKAFVANGTSPSFSMDTSDIFQFIRTPVDREKDTPRYVGEQIEHLVLGLKEHIMVSSIGASNNFSTYDGATSWSIGDTITGLVAAPDNTLLILANDSIRRLSGSGATGQDAFSVSTHSTSGGAKHYSGVYVGEPVFLDDFGLSTLQVTQKFGDFDQGKLNYGVEDWLRGRLANHTADDSFGYQSLLEVVPVRGKNQIRAYFNDGWILTVSWPSARSESRLPKFTTQNYSFAVSGTQVTGQGYEPSVDDQYKPTALSSYVTSWGEERLLIGLEDGRVAILDQGVSFFTDDINGGFAVNPFRGENPLDDSVYTTGLTLSAERDYLMHLRVSSGIDYDSPPWVQSGSWGTGNTDTIDTDPYLNRYVVSTVEVFENNIASSTSWRVYFQHSNSEFIRPIKFIAIAPKLRARGRRKARVQKSVVANS